MLREIVENITNYFARNRNFTKNNYDSYSDDSYSELTQKMDAMIKTAISKKDFAGLIRIYSLQNNLAKQNESSLKKLLNTKKLPKTTTGMLKMLIKKEVKDFRYNPFTEQEDSNIPISIADYEDLSGRL